MKTFRKDRKRVGLIGSNDVNIYCQNNETSTYAKSRDLNDEHLEEILTAHFFQKKLEKPDELLITEMCN